MSNDDGPRFQGKLTRAEVEAKLASGNYIEHRDGKPMRDWLEMLGRQEADKASARQEQREDEALALSTGANKVAIESNEIARGANRLAAAANGSAKVANRLSVAALVVAVLSAVLTLCER